LVGICIRHTSAAYHAVNVSIQSVSCVCTSKCDVAGWLPSTCTPEPGPALRHGDRVFRRAPPRGGRMGASGKAHRPFVCKILLMLHIYSAISQQRCYASLHNRLQVVHMISQPTHTISHDSPTSQWPWFVADVMHQELHVMQGMVSLHHFLSVLVSRQQKQLYKHM
jgi:hypothetical protein